MEFPGNEAVMLLGTVTDTQDTSGTVLKTREVNVTKRQILEVCSSFEGEYDQIPPMYSALKVNGKKLYELARAGVEVERKPRRIKINSLRVNDINLEDDIKTVTITVDAALYSKEQADSILETFNEDLKTLVQSISFCVCNKLS